MIIVRIISALSLSFLVVLTFVAAVSRYFFGSPISWLEEVQVPLFSIVVFIGISLALQRNDHVDLGMGKSHNNKGISFLNIGYILEGFIIIICLWFSVNYIIDVYILGRTSSVLGAPTWLYMLPLPLGFFIYLIPIIKRLGAGKSQNSGDNNV